MYKLYSPIIEHSDILVRWVELQMASLSVSPIQRKESKAANDSYNWNFGVWFLLKSHVEIYHVLSTPRYLIVKLVLIYTRIRISWSAHKLIQTLELSKETYNKSNTKQTVVEFLLKIPYSHYSQKWVLFPLSPFKEKKSRWPMILTIETLEFGLFSSFMFEIYHALSTPLIFNSGIGFQNQN